MGQLQQLQQQVAQNGGAAIIQGAGPNGSFVNGGNNTNQYAGRPQGNAIVVPTQQQPAQQQVVGNSAQGFAVLGTNGGIQTGVFLYPEEERIRQLVLKIANGAGSDKSNVIVIPGPIGLIPSFAMDTDLTYSLEDRDGNGFTHSGGAANVFAFSTSSDAFGFFAGFTAHVGMVLQSMKIEADDEANIINNKLVSWHAYPNGELRRGKSMKVDNKYFVPNRAPSVFQHSLPDFQYLNVPMLNALSLDVLKANSYIELTFDVHAYNQGTPVSRSR